MSEITKTMTSKVCNRDTLFGDLPLAYWATVNIEEQPWTMFKAAKKSLDAGQPDKAIETLNKIIAMPGLESRQYLQAYHFLAEHTVQPRAELQLLGVVVEVSIEGAHDFLAVYADHSARYYNYSGNSIILDTKDSFIAGKIDNILKQGMAIVEIIGPCKQKRPDSPTIGNARINFLTSHGLHFGEAPQSVLFNDPMSKGIMYAMLEMMETLIDRAG